MLVGFTALGSRSDLNLIYKSFAKDNAHAVTSSLVPRPLPVRNLSVLPIRAVGYGFPMLQAQGRDSGPKNTLRLRPQGLKHESTVPALLPPKSQVLLCTWNLWVGLSFVGLVLSTPSLLPYHLHVVSLRSNLGFEVHRFRFVRCDLLPK